MLACQRAEAEVVLGGGVVVSTFSLSGITGGGVWRVIVRGVSFFDFTFFGPCGRDGLSLLGFAFEMASAAKLNLGLFRDGDFPFS